MGGPSEHRVLGSCTGSTPVKPTAKLAFRKKKKISELGVSSASTTEETPGWLLRLRELLQLTHL